MQLVHEAKPIVDAIADASTVIVDTETSSLFPFRDGKVLAGVVVKPLGGESFYIPFRHKNGGKNAPMRELKVLVAALRGRELVFHNAKYDLAVFYQEGHDLANEDVLDTIVLHRLVEEDEYSYALKSLAKQYIDKDAGKPELRLKKLMRDNGWFHIDDEGKKQYHYDEVPAEAMIETGYVQGDVDYTEFFYERDMPVIERRGLVPLLELEQEVTEELFREEAHGFKVDRKFLERRRRKFTKDARAAERAIFGEVEASLKRRMQGLRKLDIREAEELAVAWALYGEEQRGSPANTFKVQSAGDLKKIFHGLGVRSPSRTAGGKRGEPQESWDKDALATLAERQPDLALATLVVEYRGILNLKKYYDNICRLMSPDDVIHCSIRQAGARTGRFSCAEPNLQNIPKRGKLAAREGEKELAVLSEVRQGFVPRPGHFLLSADWSQIEIRVLADYAGERRMMEAFNLGLDVHAVAARAAYGPKPEGKERADWWRGVGKGINFGLCYGMGLRALARKIEAEDEDEAALFREAYFQKFPKIARFIRQVNEMCESRGWVKNKWGRRRYLAEGDEYMGVNFLIQGTSADFMRDALVRTGPVLRREQKTEMLIEIHDEFIMEVPYGRKRQVVEFVIEQMERCDPSKLTVPLRVDLSWSATNWQDSESLMCGPCGGLGVMYGMNEEEIAEALFAGDYAMLDRLKATECEKCGGKGYDLSLIKESK